MDKQAREARKMAKELPLREKFSYIWMYYKEWIIGVLFVVIAIGTTAYQVATRQTYDMEIGYYAEKMITKDTLAALEEYLANYVEDINGDGVSTVKVHPNIASVIGGGQDAMETVQNKLLSELTAAQYSVFFFGDYFYDIVQVGAFEGCMESLRNIEESEELKNIINPPDGTVIYWGTRTLYDAEIDKPEKVFIHQKAVETEEAILGER